MSICLLCTGNPDVVEILREQGKDKIDFEAKNNEGKTAIEMATEVQTQAFLHKWLMSLENNPTNPVLQRMKKGGQQGPEYDLSGDESGDSDVEK